MLKQIQQKKKKSKSANLPWKESSLSTFIYACEKYKVHLKAPSMKNKKGKKGKDRSKKSDQEQSMTAIEKFEKVKSQLKSDETNQQLVATLMALLEADKKIIKLY